MPATRRARAASWASDDVLPALSGRAAQLEALARSLQTELDRASERLAAYSEFDGPLEQALVDAYRGAEAIQHRARMDADAALETALDDRRLLLKDLDRLRIDRDRQSDEIAFARRGRIMPLRAVPERAHAPVAEHRAILAAEMRLILGALLKDTFGPRPVAAQPKAAVRPPPTLLRAPLPGTRKRRELPPHRAAAPARATSAIGGPSAGDLVEAPPVQDAAPGDAVAETVAKVARADAEVLADAAVLQEIAAVIEVPADLSGMQQTTEPIAPVFDEVETPAFTPSADVPAVTEPDHALVSEQVTETIETIEEHRAIALQLVEAFTAISDIVAETKTEPPLDLAQEEPSLARTEPIGSASELSIEEHTDVPVTVEEHIDVAVPVDEQETIGRVVHLPAAPAWSAEPIAPMAVDAITDLWDTALGATQSGQEIPTALAPSSSQVEMAVETASSETPHVTTEVAQNADAALFTQHSTSVSPTQPPEVALRRAARELQLVLSPITSFPELLAIQHRIASLSSVSALQLRDFRNGVATFAASVTDALSGREFGSVLQMLGDLHLRLEGATENGVELRVEAQVP